MQFQTEGDLMAVEETVFVGQNGLKKRTAVIRNGRDRYGNDINLSVFFYKDDCDQLDTYQIGDRVALEGVIESRKYREHHYTDCIAHRIKKIETAAAI